MKTTDTLVAFLREALAPYFFSQDTWRTAATYTPIYYGGTTAGITGHTFQSGAYRRLGDVAIVTGQVNWSSATGTGEARVSLPFAPATYNFTGSLWLSGVTFANSAPQMFLGAGAYFVMDSPLTNAAPTRVAVEAAGSLVWTVTYFI
jgi:hypothetical protein